MKTVYTSKGKQYHSGYERTASTRVENKSNAGFFLFVGGLVASVIGLIAYFL